MAKILLGGMLADARGKMGGLVFSRNKAGLYIRRKVKGTNPNTSAQQNVRMNLAEISRAYGLLDEAQKLAWKAWAVAHPVKNKLGASVERSGEQWFVSMNRNANTAGLAAIDTPPQVDPTFVDGPIFSEVLMHGTPTAKLSLKVAQNIADTDVVQVYASAPLSPGVTSSFKYKQIATLTGTAYAAGAYVDIQAAYVAVYGTIPTATTRRIAIKSRQYKDGLLSVDDLVSSVVSFS